MGAIERFRRRLILLAAVGVLVALTVGPAAAGAALWTEPAGAARREDPDLARLNGALVRLVRDLRPAVVQIGVRGGQGAERELPPDHPPLPPGETPTVGSGIVLSPDGYILTNQHVVDEAREIDVQLMDGRKFPAKVVGQDGRTDLALLKVEAAGLPVLPLGDSERVEVGELVLAIGNPFGLEDSVSLGIVNRKGRAPGGVGLFVDYIQTDASVNPGNSGGPLLNMRGEVIGVNTAIIPNRRVAFAIPSNLAKSLLPDLQAKGRIAWGFLGVGIQDLNAELAAALGVADPAGALVNNVLGGFPAAAAGLQRGDVILQFDGRAMPNVRALQRAVAFTPVGKQVEVQIFREGSRRTLSVTVGEAPTAERRAVPTPARRELGMTVEELDAEKGKKFKLQEGTEGLVVTDVVRGGPAAGAGVRAGDLVREVNRREVRSVADYRSALRREAAEADVVLLKRGEAYLYVAVKPRA